MRHQSTYTITRILPAPRSAHYLDKFHQKLVSSKWSVFIASISLFLKNPELALTILKIKPVWYAAAKVLGVVGGSLAVAPIILVGELGLSVVTMVLVVAAGIAGFVLPEVYVAERMWHRQARLRAQFPNFLDLLKLYTASRGYEGFGSALVTIAQAVPGELGVELREVTKISHFVGQEELLNTLEARFPYPVARDLAATVRLERSYGGGIAPKIAILADEAQKERLAHARAAGQRSSVGLLVPLLFFHFPVALILFVLPFAYSILQALGSQ